MEGWLRERPEVATLYNLISFQMGSYLFVAVKARMAERDSAARLIDQVNAVLAAIDRCFREQDTWQGKNIP